MDLNPDWEYVADTVMGGVSDGTAARVHVQGRHAMRLTGSVSTDNNGGFIQMAFDLSPGGGPVDASGWQGIELDVRGNGEEYDVRLRTEQLSRPWQSFRASIRADHAWTTVRISFDDFAPHRTDVAFDPAYLRRIGILAVGRDFTADVAVSGIRLYR